MTPTRDLVATDAQAVVADFAGYVLDFQPHEVAAIDGTTRFDADGLNLDSLALLELATAVARFFRLYESELEDELLRRRSVSEWAGTIMRAWTYGSRRLTFTTSGTTAAPVRCTHRWELLTQELDAHAEMFADRRRVVGLVSPRHIYGFLFCVLLPRWLDVPFVDARSVSPSRLVALARSDDLVVGFPHRWDIASSEGLWPPRVTGVTSTGPIKPATVTALRARGLARMVEIYGSSETAGVAWRDDQAEPLRVYAHWSLRGPSQLARVDPESPGEPLLFDAPDILKIRADGFDMVGRRDGAVQVGGVNVSCPHVAQVIAEHPYVAECAVRLMKEDEGARLKAFVVLADSIDEETARPALRASFRERLSAPEAPASVTYGPVLPRDPHGKLADWSAQPAARSDFE